MNKILLVVGVKGSGKTFLTKRLVKTIDKQVIVYDTINQFTELPEMKKDDFDFRQKVRISFIRPKDFKKAFDYPSSVVVIDEVDHYCEPENKDHLKYLNPLIKFSRNFRIDVILTAKRLNSLKVSMRSQVDFVVIGITTELNDLKVLREYGIDVELVKSLKDYEFLIWSTKKRTFKVVKNTQVNFCDF